MTDRPAPTLAVIILTRDEALHIARAIDCIRPLATQIVVVDSGSTDATVAIAQAAGAVVLHNPWINHASQFNWALDHAPIAADWIMRLDADEVVGADLVAELRTMLPALAADVAGVTLNRRHVFMGRWLRHGGRSPLWLLRVWRRGAGRVEDRWMDEHVVLSRGRTVTASGWFADVNLHDLGHFTRKHEGYATAEAIDLLCARYGLIARPDTLAFGSTARQASVKRLIKTRVYNAMPFWLAAPLYVAFRYVVQLGFLDGMPGLIYHGLQGGWYRFLVGAKVHEFDRVLAPLSTPAERRTALAALTGRPI